MFKRLQIDGWRQFGEIDISFHPRLTVLTGANGAGKTTILNILNRHAGWNLSFLGTPQLTKKGAIRYFTGLWRRRDEQEEAQVSIGSISYTSGGTAHLEVPSADAPQYSVKVRGQEQVHGIFVPSHRPINTYAPVANIPTSVKAHTQLLDNYLNELRQRYQPGSRIQYSPAYRMKEALIALATFGYGNQVVQGNPEYVRIFESFNDILRVVLPRSLGFVGLHIRIPEVVLETRTGEFLFDSVSGGALSIIDMAWQLHMKSQEVSDFAVMIDEPENHLHPTMQRTILADFMAAFSTCQFVVATHNPFIVTSVPESNVYVLDYDETGYVQSRILDLVDRSGSANQILRDVLGVGVLMPQWVEEKLDEIVRRHASLVQTNASQLRELERELESIGLRGLFPEAATRIADEVSGRD
jgi:predicted ATP-binding protein involved in virulence